MSCVYCKIQELGLEIPVAPKPAGLYQPVVQVGNLLYVSGQGATVNGAPYLPGKVGGNLTLEEGQAAAKVCALNCLSVLQAYLGDLNRITRLVKTLGFVASAEGFSMQPAAMNGCSQVFKDIWGDKGVGARSAIGVNELPGGIAVEVEFIFEIAE